MPFTAKELSAPEAARHTEVVHERCAGTSFDNQEGARVGLVLGGTSELAVAGNRWNRLRYLGGTVPAKVNEYDWNTRLTVSADAIELVFAGRDAVRIAPTAVTAMANGQRRIAGWGIWWR